MNKTLFSLAFLAASGGYVAYTNHGLDGLLPGSARPDEREGGAIVAPAAKASNAPTVLDQAPKASVTIAPPVISHPTAPVFAQPAITKPKTVVASATPINPAPAPVALSGMPPLPRPRPADAPTVETAQAAAGAQASAGQYRDGTYTGTDENAYYGRVQVQVTVVNSQIASVKMLDYPSDRRTSRYINSQALPMLQQEVMQAQSVNVDTVSGATLTSDAYIKSLANALSKAVGGNA